MSKIPLPPVIIGPTTPIVIGASNTVPAGGSAGEVLEKTTGADYDYAWTALPAIPTSSPTVTDETTYGITPDAGTPGTYANGDHTHGSPTAPVIPVVSTTVKDETTYGISPSAGSSGKWSDGDHTHGSQPQPAKVRYVPDSVTLNVGTLNSGDVDSVKVPFDANVYSVQEHSGVPGYDIQFDFADVLSFNRINLHHAYFGGTPTHYVSIQLYNFSAAAWNHVTVFLNGANYNQWITIEGIPCANYIDAGVVKLKYYHESSGDPSHQIAVDYVSLVQDFDA